MPTSVKNQELAEEFLTDDAHLGRLLIIDDLDLLTLYDPATGSYPCKADAYKCMQVYMLKYIAHKAHKNVTMGVVDDVIEQVKIQCTRHVRSIQSRYIAFKDTLLDVITQEKHAFNPDKLAFWTIPHQLADVLAAPDPKQFLSFLDDVIVEESTLVPDKATQGIIQEMFGYCFLPTSKAEASFFLVGDGSNGKSVLLNVLRSTIGREYCSAKSIETLTINRFSASSLANKIVNICSEEESKYLKSDKFKSIISGEESDVEIKFGRSFEMMFFTKFIFATNEPPSFEGFNHGLLRRLIIINLNRKIEADKRDAFLTEKIIGTESLGIIKWALAGAARVLKQGLTFSKSAATIASHAAIRSNLSSAAMYMTENYTEDADSYMGYDAIFEDYKLWAAARGKKPLSFYSFCDDIKQVLTIPAPKNPKWIDGKNVRGRYVARKPGEWGEETSLTALTE